MFQSFLTQPWLYTDKYLFSLFNFSLSEPSPQTLRKKRLSVAESQENKGNTTFYVGTEVSTYKALTGTQVSPSSVCHIYAIEIVTWLISSQLLFLSHHSLCKVRLSFYHCFFSIYHYTYICTYIHTYLGGTFTTDHCSSCINVYVLYAGWRSCICDLVICERCREWENDG